MLNMFLSDEQEKEFLNILTTYESEFGAERVIVYLPLVWKKINLEIFKPMEVKLWNLDYIKLEVRNLSANYTQRI